MTPAAATPSTTSPFLFPQGSWCQDCSTFWRRPPRITNVQMRMGGESDPDSDVLQLVAGVKKEDALPATGVRAIYTACACMNTSGAPVRFSSTCVPLRVTYTFIFVCALTDVWCARTWLLMALCLYGWSRVRRLGLIIYSVFNKGHFFFLLPL